MDEVLIADQTDKERHSLFLKELCAKWELRFPNMKGVAVFFAWVEASFLIVWAHITEEWSGTSLEPVRGVLVRGRE